MITWPTNTTEITDEIRDVIGRDITIYVKASGIPCTNPLDSYDPVTKRSTNPFCTVCSGKYFLDAVSGYPVKARIRTKMVASPILTVAGEYFEGDVQVQIKLTPANITAVENSAYYIVDDRKYKQESFQLRGVPESNRILVVLLEQ